jgi:hypothetical protein
MTFLFIMFSWRVNGPRRLANSPRWTTTGNRASGNNLLLWWWCEDIFCPFSINILANATVIIVGVVSLLWLSITKNPVTKD